MICEFSIRITGFMYKEKYGGSMGFFKSKIEKELDFVASKIDMNMSNNYKDAAQASFVEFEKAFLQAKDAGLLKASLIDKYNNRIAEYRQRLSGYTHKEQLPDWKGM